MTLPARRGLLAMKEAANQAAPGLLQIRASINIAAPQRFLRRNRTGLFRLPRSPRWPQLAATQPLGSHPAAPAPIICFAATAAKDDKANNNGES
jgi:hypothetical protein